jgi:hypothetical protein
MTASAGRGGRRWIRLTKEVKARARAGEACCRCGQRIDTTLAWPDPQCFSTDHYPFPLSTHPHLAEDPGNLRPAHLVCNQTAGNKHPLPGLGRTSEEW